MYRRSPSSERSSIRWPSLAVPRVQSDMIWVCPRVKSPEPCVRGLTPTSHATGLTNVYRDDVPWPCLTPEAALDQAPAVELQRFKVPRILGEE